MSQQVDPRYLQALRWRCIGPPRGGRVVAVAGHPTQPMTFYFGACAGGVWKTEDGGQYWSNITDGYLTSAAIGAITVAESDPNVIYVGTGESTIRLDVSYGDGIYKTTDGGQTWRNMGLRDTKHIGEIRVHPQNPDLVYVAALGHAFGPNEERGVFRSRNGGETWEKVLYVSDKAGAVDIAMDPTNPRILYASIWEAYRNFWYLSSGGDECGLYKSTDGGDSWVNISRNPGMPKGMLGKIGVTVSPAMPNRVWAIMEAGDEEGVYRSDDSGATWTRINSDRALLARPWYYCHIFADPQDAETVYVTNLKMWKSTDGGKNYTEITTTHGDNHDLWIDPRNPQRMIEGNDGGACVSFNGGNSWSTAYNQLTAQFYHVAVDSQYPYHVYGTQQDNSSLGLPSKTGHGAILWQDAYTAGTGESGYIAVKPDDPNVVFLGAIGSSPGGGGALQRYDHRTKQVRLVTVWPEAHNGWDPSEIKYRFAWTYPIVFSPHDPNVLYAGGNHVFRSTDEGSSWEEISPDLSRADPEKLKASGGPVTLDTSGAEHYGTVFAFAESPHQPGLLWAGTDDGLVHVSPDGGVSWVNVTPTDLPEWSLISLIEVSPHDDKKAYVAATRYKLDDYRPFLFKTGDNGRSWQNIAINFPQNEITRVIREDPRRPGLLYVGTETGIFVSFNDGADWQRLAAGFPVVPVYDMVVKDDDLVVATHGRSFWVLDDLSVLRQMGQEVMEKQAHLFRPADTIRRWINWRVYPARTESKNYMISSGVGVTFTEKKNEYNEPIRKFLDAGENPPQGVLIYYTLPENSGEPVTLELLDGAGVVIETFRDRVQTAVSPPNESEADKKKREAKRTLSTQAGLNCFLWDMRYPDATAVPGDPFSDGITAPLAAPGTYQVRLTVGDTVQTQEFVLRPEPHLTATREDLLAQFELWLQIRDKLTETNEAIMRIRRIRQQVDEWVKRATDNEAVASTAAALKEKLAAIEGVLYQTDAKTSFDRLRLKVKLNTKISTLISIVAAADERPPKQAYDVFEHLSVQVDAQLAQLNELVETDVAAFSALVQQEGIPAIGLD